MSHVDQGPLSHYNSLSDNHLSGFFNNPRMRKHLRKSGLINKDGYIVSEKMYRLNMCRKEQKKHVKDMIAQAIVHKTLDLERTRQAEIRKKLEEIAKIELVRNIKMSRQRKRDVEVLPFINSRSGSRQRSHSNPANGQSKRRSVSAPSKKAKRPVSELSSNYDDDDEDLVVYLDDEGRPIPKSHFNEPEGRLSKKDVIDTRNLYSLNPTALRKYALMMAKMEQSKNGPDSPYLEPQVPLPPKSPRSGRMPRSARRYMSITDKQKQSSPQRPSTAAHRQTGGSPQRLRVQQVPRCQITMCYLGSQLNLAREQFDKQQEVIIEQQHCGGNTLTVFKGRLEPGEEFNFTSYRHCGYPFALTMYIDGKTDSRISTCCEYRHRKGCRVFGKNGHFSLVEISADASPCYKCQVEHGLKDKNNSKGSKPKKNQQPVEDQEEVVIPEQKKEETPREEEEDDLIDGPPKRHLEVPVEDDDPKGNGKYDDDDFESSSSDSGSESSSSNDSSRSSKRSTKSQSSNSESDKDVSKNQGKEFIEQTNIKIEIINCNDESSIESSYNNDQGNAGSASSEKSSSTDVKNEQIKASQQPLSYLKYPDMETGIYIEKIIEGPTSTSGSVEDKQEVMSSNNKKVMRNILPVNTDLADTADEVSDIESEIALSPEADGNSVQFFRENHGCEEAVEDCGSGKDTGHVSDAKATEKKGEQQKKKKTSRDNANVKEGGLTQHQPEQRADGKGKVLKRVKIKETPAGQTEDTCVARADGLEPGDKVDISFYRDETRNDKERLKKQKRSNSVKRRSLSSKSPESAWELEGGNSMKAGLDGKINTIPMAKTGQNKYLRRQEQKEARRQEKKKSKVKAVKDTKDGVGKKYKDLSPKERVIPGHPWDSISDGSSSRVIPCHGASSTSEQAEEAFHVGKAEGHKMVEVSESLVQESIPQFSVLNGGNDARTVVALEHEVDPNFRYATGVDDSRPKDVLGQAPARNLAGQEEDSRSKDGSVDGQVDPSSLHVSDLSSTLIKENQVDGPKQKPCKASQVQPTGQSDARLKSSKTISLVKQRGGKYDRVDEVSEHSSTQTDTQDKVHGCNVINGLENMDWPGRNKNVAEQLFTRGETTGHGVADDKSDIDKEESNTIFEDDVVDVKGDTDLDCSTPAESVMKKDYISGGSTVKLQPDDGSLDINTGPGGQGVNNTESLLRFFSNDNQDTDAYNTSAEIVRTRFVEKEADRYVRHQRAFDEPPSIDNKLFVDAGEKILILRPQSPSKIQPDAEPVVFSILRPGDSYGGPIIRPALQRKQYRNFEESPNVRSVILIPDKLDELTVKCDDDDDEMIAGDDNWEDMQLLQDIVQSNIGMARQEDVGHEGRNWYEVNDVTSAVSSTVNHEQKRLLSNCGHSEIEASDSEESHDHDGVDSDSEESHDHDGVDSDSEGGDSDRSGSSSDDAGDSEDDTSEGGDDQRCSPNDIIHGMEEYPRGPQLMTSDIGQDIISAEDIPTGGIDKGIQDDKELIMIEDESIGYGGESKKTGTDPKLANLTADANSMAMCGGDKVATEAADLTGGKDRFPIIEISTASYSNIATYESMDYWELLSGAKNTDRKQTLQIPMTHNFEDVSYFKTRPVYDSGSQNFEVLPALERNRVDGRESAELTLRQESEQTTTDSDDDSSSTSCSTKGSHEQSVKYNDRIYKDSIAKEIREAKEIFHAEVKDVYPADPGHQGESHVNTDEGPSKDWEAIETITNNEDHSGKSSVSALIACLEEQLVAGGSVHSGFQSISTGSTGSSFDLDHDGDYFQDGGDGAVDCFNDTLPDSVIYTVESSPDNKKKRDKGKQTGAQHKIIAVQDKKNSDSSDNEDNRKKADKGKHKETKQSVVPVKGKMDSDSSDEEYSVKKVKEKSFQSRGQESIVTEVKDSDSEDEREVSFTVKTTEKKSYESTLLMETSKSTVTGKKMELQDSPRSQGSVSSSSSSSSSSGSVRRRSTQPVSSPKRAETTHHQADKPKIVPQPPTSPPPGDTMKVRKSPEPRKAEPVQSPAVQRTPAPEVDSDKDPQPARKESKSSVSSSTSSSSSSSSGNSSSRSSSDSENEALNQNSQGSGVIPAINLQAPVERSGEPISKKETHLESSLEPMRKKEHHLEGSLEGSLEPFSKKETHLERSVEPVSKKEAPVETHKDPVSQKEIEKVEVTMAHGDVATVGDENILDLVPKRRDSETSVRSSSSSSSASSSSSSSSSGSLNIPENTPRQEQGTDLTEAKREPLDDKGIGTFEKEPQLRIEEDNSLFLEEENALLEVEEKALFGDDEETQIVRQDENSEVSEHDEAENVPIIAPLRPPPAPITMPGPITVDFVKEKGEDKSDSGSGSESDSDSGSSSSSSSISGRSSDSGRSSKSDSGNKEGKAPVISTESVIETTADIHKSQSETVDTKQDPDVVVDADVAKGNFEEGVSKMSHSSPDPIAAPEPPEPRAGSILPELQKAQQIVDIKGVLLTKSQIDESVLFLLNKQAMDQMHFVNCGLHDKDLHVLGTAVRKSPANPVVLNFSFNPLTVNCVDDLLALAKDKPSIEAILLQGTHLGDEGIQKLVDGLLKQHREKFNKDGDVAEATITSSDSVDFDNVKELHELDLTKSGIGDKGVKALCTLIRSDMAIDTLNLSLNKEITLEGWKELAQAIQKTRHLETLTLDHNHIGNEGIEELTKGLFENTSILALDLNNIGITDQGGKFIIELLKRNTSILEINLAGNKISNQLLEDISKYTALNKSVE